MKKAMYVGLVCLAVLAAMPWTVSAQPAATAQPTAAAPKAEAVPAGPAAPVTCIDVKAAHTAILAALGKAEGLNCLISVAVFDAGADLKAFVRMDGAALSTADYAMEAGKQSASLGLSTAEIVAQGLGSDTVALASAVPVRSADGKLLGAIAVAGGFVNNVACAEAAAADLGAAPAAATGAVGGPAAAAPDDKAQIMEGLKLFKEGMEKKDIEKLKGMLSDSFSHYEFGGKDGLIAFVQMTMSQGDLDNAEMDLEYVEIKIEGDTATVYPIELVAAFGSATIELKLKKEAAGWRVVGMEMEGV